jgi:hypothetical protein
MSEFRPFFIVGLPRSRTAWLANLLTVPGQSFCWHEGEAGHGNLEQLVEKMKRRPESRVGNASSALAFYGDDIYRLLPEARYIIIERDLESAKQALIKVANEYVDVDSVWPHMVKKFNAFIESLSEHYVLKIRYDQLHDEETCINTWNFATNELPWDSERWQMLTELNVQANVASRAAKCAVMPPSEQNTPTQKPVAADIIPDCHEEYYRILREFLPEQAITWVHQACRIARFWDHIVDGDPISKLEAEISFNALLFEWPEMPFYNDFGPQLRNAVKRSIFEWRNGNAWDLCYRLPMMCAVSAGDIHKFHEVAPRLKEVINQITLEDTLWELEWH